MKLRSTMFLSVFCLFVAGLFFGAEVSRASDTSPCSRIALVKEIPFKNEIVSDNNWNALLSEGKNLNRCLIDSIKNSTEMPDPRKAPKFEGYAVGDLAYGIFVRVNNISFDKLLPEDVRKKFKDVGVYAYFEYVSKPENRDALSKVCRDFLDRSAEVRPSL